MANPLIENQTQTEAIARTLTTSAEAGIKISKELDAMTPAERVKVAHRMEELNKSDTAKNSQLPTLRIYFDDEFSEESLKTLQKVRPDLKNDEHLQAIQVRGDYVYDNSVLSDEISNARMEKIFTPEVKQRMAMIDERRQAFLEKLNPEQLQEYKREEAQISFYYRGLPLMRSPMDKPATPLFDAIQNLSNPDTIWY